MQLVRNKTQSGDVMQLNANQGYCHHFKGIIFNDISTFI